MAESLITSFFQKRKMVMYKPLRILSARKKVQYFMRIMRKKSHINVVIKFVNLKKIDCKQSYPKQR